MKHRLCRLHGRLCSMQRVAVLSSIARCKGGILSKSAYYIF